MITAFVVDARTRGDLEKVGQREPAGLIQQERMSLMRSAHRHFLVGDLRRGEVLRKAFVEPDLRSRIIRVQ